MHADLHLVRCGLEQHFEFPCAAVLDRILQRFLQNSEQTKLNFLRQLRDITGLEVDLEIVPLREFSAIPRRRFHKSQILQF